MTGGNAQSHVNSQSSGRRNSSLWACLASSQTLWHGRTMAMYVSHSSRTTETCTPFQELAHQQEMQASRSRLLPGPRPEQPTLNLPLPSRQDWDKLRRNLLCAACAPNLPFASVIHVAGPLAGTMLFTLAAALATSFAILAWRE